MVKVANISVTKFNLVKEIDNAKNADMKRCLEIFGDKSRLRELMPKPDKITVSFELHGTNTDIANGIRRCLLNELSIYSFTFDEFEDLDVSDEYILCDFIKKNIDLLPINQELDTDFKDISKLEISLEADNKSDDIVEVTSSDFSIMYDGKEIKSSEVVNENIVLCRLRPAKHIVIRNIKITKGIGRDDAGKFSTFSNVSYKILDVEPLDEETGKGQSSMVAAPSKFFISYTTHRNIKKPERAMVACCDTLIGRLANILADMKNISNKDEYYYSDLLSLETGGNIKKISIKGEQWTIINMICRYCFILTNGNIKFVSPAIIHPEKEIGVINITHPEFSKLLQSAIQKCIDELEAVKSHF
jgi:DNA-directed RNA polymerase subunit L